LDEIQLSAGMHRPLSPLLHVRRSSVSQRRRVGHQVGVFEALAHLEHERTTVATNELYARRQHDFPSSSASYARCVSSAAWALPHGKQLAAMLDAGTYQLEALAWTTRIGVKRLGLAVAEQLV
jgi:hypothetical protein